MIAHCSVFTSATTSGLFYFLSYLCLIIRWTLGDLIVTHPSPHRHRPLPETKKVKDGAAPHARACRNPPKVCRLALHCQMHEQLFLQVRTYLGSHGLCACLKRKNMNLFDSFSSMAAMTWIQQRPTAKMKMLRTRVICPVEVSHHYHLIHMLQSTA
jgi:hypothetical protein